jgi:hypothetical protein
VTDPSQVARVEQKKAEGPGLVRCWLQAEPARKLPNLSGIPIAVVTSEASFRATYDQCTSEYLTQPGVPNTHLRLAHPPRHTWQRSHDDAREEQRRYRRGDRGLAPKKT